MLQKIAGDAEDCVERARRLAPRIAAAAPRIEADRQLTTDVLDALHAARLFRLLIPRAYDGDEAEPAVFVQALEELAKADASTAWCVGQAAGGSMAAAYLAPDAAREIFADPRAVIAGGPGTRGTKAIAVDGGYRVTGSWKFASGSRHATWMIGHCVVCEPDGTPRMADGKALERSMLFPRASAAFEDVWQVSGLKGTGSDNYAIEDLFVPAKHSFTRDAAADRREPGALYRFSIFSMFGIAFAAIALGIARATLDAFIALAAEKTPTSGTTVLRENAAVQSQVGIAEARLQSSHAFLLTTLRDLYAAAGGAGISRTQQVSLRLATTYAIQQARDVVDMAYHAAGASAIFEKNPFERRFRDIHAVTQQVQAHAANFELAGQVLLGLPAKGKIF